MQNKEKLTSQPLEIYKVIFLGDYAVGKTAIINRYAYDSFNPTHRPTVGIDMFYSKNFDLNDRKIRYQLWDTAGQERFRSLIPSYLRNMSIAIICYDITNIDTFRNACTMWVDKVRQEKGDNALIYLLGNKTDLIEKRVISQEEAKIIARDKGVKIKEVSAKSGENIKELFTEIAMLLQPEKNSLEYNGLHKDQSIIKLSDKKQQDDEKKIFCC